MKFFLKQTIYLLPILLMAVSFLSVIVPWFGFNFDYTLWGNIGGFSLVTDVLFFYVFRYGNYCAFTKYSPIALFMANLVNILGVIFPKYYHVWYEIVIFSLILTIILIYEMKILISK